MTQKGRKEDAKTAVLRELELRLLVMTEEVHTESGRHVKTAIGTMLPTGCAIGTGANVFGSRRPEPVVPPFAWGTDEPADVLSCQRFVEIAERVMPRRDVTVDQATRSYLKAVWRAATGRGECD